MQFDGNIIKNSFRLYYYKLILQARGKYLIIKLISLLMFILIFLIYGILLALLFYFRPYSITTVAYRDILVDILLTVYVTAFVFLVISGITGITNPFINSRPDAHFIERVPVELSICYLSTRINGFFVTILMLSIVVTSLFGYLVILIHLPIWRLVIIFLGCFFGLDFCTSMSRICFFIFQRVRRQQKLFNIWANNPNVSALSLFLVPGLALYLFTQHFLISFSTLANFYFLPLINTAVAITGCFFRSGMPLISWEALIVSVIYSILLNIITINLALKPRSIQDIIDILPALKHQDSIRENFFKGGKILEPSDIVKNADFPGKKSFKLKSPFYALVLKDWLAITRLREIRSYLYLVPIAMGMFIVKYVFFGENSQINISFFTNFDIGYFLLIIPFYIIASYSLVIVQIDYKNPLQQYPVKKMDVFLTKGAILVGGIGIACFPLLIMEGVFGLALIILTSGIALILGKTRLGVSRFGVLIIIGVAMFMTTLASI